MSFYSKTGRERLVKTHEKSDMGTFDDLLHCCMCTVEDGLITSGLVPGRDYTAMDLAKLAMPLALEWSKGKDIAITTGYPAGHPHEGNPSELADMEGLVLKALKTSATGEKNKSSLSLALGRGSLDRKNKLWAALDNLIQMGLVSARPGTNKDDHNTYYRLTAAGKKAVPA